MTDTSNENSPAVAPLHKESSPLSTKSLSSSLETKKQAKENGTKETETDHEKGQVSIFQLASEIEKSLNDLRSEIASNEKDFIATLNKIEQQLNRPST
ncbi:hypothetical protein MOUN0_L01398 [Monosporozyma unispora]|nr:hypothetical protein C6P44_000508 [Kazachstania unispora]